MNFAKIDEKQLISQILKGNIKLFEEIIHRYQRLAISIIIRFVSNQFDRDEICQEVFIKVYQNLASFKFNSKFSTWIGRITYNHCINYTNKTSKFSNFDSIDDLNYKDSTFEFVDNTSKAINDDYEIEETTRLINNYVDKLPEIYQTILNLFHVQEMSYKEISDILNLPEGTVKSYLFRSRKLLKEKLLSSHKEEELI